MKVLGMPRSGLSLLEVLLAGMILLAGVLPLVQVFQSSSQRLGSSQLDLVLQNRAMQALAEASSMIVAGHFADLNSEEEEVLEKSEAGVQIRLQIRSLRDLSCYRVEVRAESEGRFFALTQKVSDPLASVYRDSVEEIDPTALEGEVLAP